MGWATSFPPAWCVQDTLLWTCTHCCILTDTDQADLYSDLAGGMSWSGTSSPACSRKLGIHICCCLLSSCSGVSGAVRAAEAFVSVAEPPAWTMAWGGKHPCVLHSCSVQGLTMTPLSLGQYLINYSPCHRLQKGRTEGDTGQWLQKADFFCHIRAKTRAHSNLRELVFALYCSELLSTLIVRANVLYFYLLCIPVLPQPKSCFNVCCISRSVAESTKY